MHVIYLLTVCNRLFEFLNLLRTACMQDDWLCALLPKEPFTIREIVIREVKHHGKNQCHLSVKNRKCELVESVPSAQLAGARR